MDVSHGQVRRSSRYNREARCSESEDDFEQAIIVLNHRRTAEKTVWPATDATGMEMSPGLQLSAFMELLDAQSTFEPCKNTRTSQLGWVSSFFLLLFVKINK